MVGGPQIALRPSIGIAADKVSPSPQGLRFLAHQSIVHRSLRPEHVVISLDEPRQGMVTAKLADFTCASNLSLTKPAQVSESFSPRCQFVDWTLSSISTTPKIGRSAHSCSNPP